MKINVKRFREREAEDDRKFLREKEGKRIERVKNVHITVNCLTLSALQTGSIMILRDGWMERERENAIM